MRRYARILMTVCITAGFLLPCRADDVRVRRQVQVTGDVVRLIDLLDSGAAAKLPDRLRDVPLFPAPRVGSWRALKRNEIVLALANHPGLASARIIPNEVLVTRRGFAIPDEAIRTALERGFPGITVLKEVPGFAAAESRVAAPALAVAGSIWNRNRKTLEVRMRCVPAADCGKFLVGVPFRDEDVLPLRRGFSSKDIGKAAGPLLTQAGKAATLLLESGGIRLTLPVVSMQAGRLAQMVRVRDQSSRQQFRGEVIGRGLVRAIF